MKDDEIDSFNCSSWCRFPLYEADFGCGKPVWVTPVLPSPLGVNNFILLMDAKDGDGIELYVFKDEEMVVA